MTYVKTSSLPHHQIVLTDIPLSALLCNFAFLRVINFFQCCINVSHTKQVYTSLNAFYNLLLVSIFYSL